MFTEPTLALTDAALQAMIDAAVGAARELGQPQCIEIVDASGVPLASFRMRGAKVLSRLSARTKAQTAASIGAPSDAIPEAVRPHIAAATQGAVTGLAGGLPIKVGSTVLGGVGVGSGTPDQDVAVAQAALAAIGAEVG